MSATMLSNVEPLISMSVLFSVRLPGVTITPLGPDA